MSARTWHKGPPPHVGWWNANAICDPELWSWWDGSEWSVACGEEDDLLEVAKAAGQKRSEGNQRLVEWCDYYPENARVPRVDPRRQTLGEISANAVHDMAKLLLEAADTLDLNVTISRRVNPLRPNEVTTTVDVWQKRGVS